MNVEAHMINYRNFNVDRQRNSEGYQAYLSGNKNLEQLLKKVNHQGFVDDAQIGAAFRLALEEGQVPSSKMLQLIINILSRDFDNRDQVQSYG
ncbi:MAG: hypothetical protein KKA19_06690 [Candidatus Margulisbacteria bacterium]|nr:hypothetical protein [Candidatus Margulisiibacteriota bacterium]